MGVRVRATSDPSDNHNIVPDPLTFHLLPSQRQPGRHFIDLCQLIFEMVLGRARVIDDHNRHCT